MKKTNTAFWMSAALCGVLMNGCGTNGMADRAEHTNRATTAKPAATKQTTAPQTDSDSDHALYEEDDVHRKTETDEPNLIDRAESALDSVESAITDKVDDAKKKMESMKKRG